MNRAARTDGWLKCGGDRSQGFRKQRRLCSFGSWTPRWHSWGTGRLHFLPCSGLQFFVSRFTIDRVFIMTGKNGRTYDLFSLIRRDCTNLAARRNNFCPLDNFRAAILIQHRYERFANGELSKHRLNFELWILPECFRGSFHRFLVARRKCAQRVLHAIPELTENNFGNIERILTK